MTAFERKLESLLEQPVKELGYELYDVMYVKEAKDYYLKVFIDKEEGISLDDCEKVSNGISDLLDEANYIKEQYFLEVSSAGLERVLRKDKHFEDNIGNDVEIKLFKPIEKQKIIIGRLKNFNEEIITIEQEEKIIEIERKNIAIIKTLYKW